MTRTQGNKSELGNVHQQNMLSSLQHRLEAAKLKGDMSLVNQLEQEMQQTNRNGYSPSRAGVSAASVAAQRTLTRDTSSAHRQNLLTNLQRRLEAARAKNDLALVAQLERELQQLS